MTAALNKFPSQRGGTMHIWRLAFRLLPVLQIEQANYVMVPPFQNERRRSPADVEYVWPSARQAITPQAQPRLPSRYPVPKRYRVS
jgi:hypothetical protein